MKRKCKMCGGLFNEFDMMSYFTGIKTEWWCWECWLNSQHEAAASEMARQQRLHRISESKNRNR